MIRICLSDSSGKTCFKCTRTLPRSEFYAHKAMADGLLGKCKSCTRTDVSGNRGRKLEYYRESDVRRYREQPKRRAAINARATENIARWPNAQRARNAVSNAIRDGRLAKGPCEVCGHSTRVHGHHDDYDQPLSVRWLCVPHHALWHQVNGEGKNR